jgi:uncharacterized repeat protein (TIGR03803 family)
MRTWALVVLLIGTGSIVAACGGSQPPLSASPAGFAPQQSLAPDVYRILHTFDRSAGDGTHPAADLIDVKGTLYGTTSSGGAHGGGAVFSITTSGKETTLYSFGESGDGVGPVAPLLDVDGTFYGTTQYGPLYGGGTVFSVTPGGTEKVLYDFPSDDPGRPQSSGSYPDAGLIEVNGTLYGTTPRGGKHLCFSGYSHCGTVFSITKSGKYTALYSFGKTRFDARIPEAGLLDVGGTLYGTTALGGTYNAGTVFSITTTGQERVLYSFGANPNDSLYPRAALIDVGGTLYGTASSEVVTTYELTSAGTVFSVAMDGTEKVLHNFGVGEDGSIPVADLKNVKGVLYGTTSLGGRNNLGTVFKITTSGNETVVHDFANGGGQNPVAGVIPVDGALYGTTFGTTADRNKNGNVFSLTP